MNTKVKGYVLAAISAATYGMNPLFALPLYEGGMDLYSVLFFRYLFAIPILAVMLKLRRREFSIEKADIMPLIILGVLFAMSSITLFSSYNPTIISLVCTTEAIQCIGSTPTAILGVLEPVTAVFFGVVIFGEVLTTRIVIGLILVIVSVTLVVAGSHTGKLLLRLRKMFPVKVNKTTGQQDDK